MDRNLAEWFASSDTGLSSKAIALFLSAGVASGRVPADSDDFGRCHRLLKRMGWQNRIGEMSESSGRWAALVEIWPQLTKAYEAGDHKEVYRLIGSVEADGYRRDGYTVTTAPDGRIRSASKGKNENMRMGDVTIETGT